MATPEAVVADLRRRADNARGAGGRAAADAMAQQFDRGIKTGELRRYPHPPGTRTPSPPGEPVGLITGHLRRSLLITPAERVDEFRWRSRIRPTAVYARIQEVGGVIVPRYARWLRWADAGGVHFAKRVRLPARPYMRPSRDRQVGDGSLRRAAEAAFADAVGGP